MERIRIGLRGAAGLLGSRFAAAITQTKDMCLAVGIFKKDATLTRMIERAKFGGPIVRDALPNVMYLEESDEVVERMNEDGMSPRFRSIKELDLARDCDIVVDAATSAKHHGLQEQYQKFPGSVLLQDGCFPYGRLIAPPLVAPPQGGNRYRQGGCFLSGVVPVLAAFKDMVRSARIHLVMQHDGRDADFTITERLNSFKVADEYIPRMQDELSQLFPGTEMVVESVIQIPGMLNYAVTLEIETGASISREDVRHRLTTRPRIRVLPDSVMSTYDVNLTRVIDDRVPPILVFGGSLQVSDRGSGSVIRMKLALYYRTLAVLPNIDAVRMLALKMNPQDAMRATDWDMKFSDSP